MNYKKIYEDLINNCKLKNKEEKYIEHHHIIPLCIGGDNDISNIVLLKPREHYLAHKLLHYIYPENNSLKYAYLMMVFTTLDALKKYKQISINRYYNISSREYEYCRNLAKDTCLKRFKGCKYINNGDIQIVIKPEELNKYLDNGWQLGKLPFSQETLEKIRKNAKLRIISDETRIKKSNSVVGIKNPCYGRKTINNGSVNKKVYPNELPDYLNNGWKLGQIKKISDKVINGYKSGKKDNISGRKYVHTESEPYLIRFAKPEDIDYYISIGWKLGQGNFVKESKLNNGNKGTWMHKENPYTRQKIQQELVDLYLSRGWKFGNGNYIKNKINNE